MFWPFAGVQAQEIAQTALRHDEDWSVSHDAPATEDDWWCRLKYLPLDNEGQIYVTLGGARSRFVGKQAEFLIGWEVSRIFSLSASASTTAGSSVKPARLAISA